MDDMEYDGTMRHWIRSAPSKVRRRIFWALIADYAIWFFAGAAAGSLAIKVWS